MGSHDNHQSEPILLADWARRVERSLRTPCDIPPSGEERWRDYREKAADLVRTWREGYLIATPFHEFVRPLRTDGRNSVRFTAICGAKGIAFRYGATGKAEQTHVVVVREMAGIGSLIDQIDRLPVRHYKLEVNRILMGWPRLLMRVWSTGDKTKITPTRQ